MDPKHTPLRRCECCQQVIRPRRIRALPDTTLCVMCDVMGVRPTEVRLQEKQTVSSTVRFSQWPAA